jgi:signal transduction histidine kinase/ActR/RegA family two-component response regulator
MNMIYEVTPEEVREDATPVFGRIHPDDFATVGEAIFESARTLQTFYAEFRVILPVQGLRWRWSQAQPERMADGSTLWHGIIIDVTARKLAEEQSERLQAQLQQAMKMEAIGRLAGGIAHDFNNLLTAIIGNASLASHELHSKELVLESLIEIGRAAESAAALTRQLLAFSRKQLVEPKVLDPNVLIRSLKKMLSRLIGENIELTTRLEPNLGAIKIDPGQFEQILVNLAVNARDSMPNGGRLLIETANVELSEEQCKGYDSTHPGPYVMLSVSDTGLGIDEDVKAHLFEPFFTTKPQGKGTGLGLATTLGVVKQAGGRIEVYSERNIGTVFKIYLPRVEEAIHPPDLEREQVEQMPGGRETILLVEDQEVVRKLAHKLLTRLGYDVIQARDGITALSALEQHVGPLDLLLTDVVMPSMSGSELAARVLALRPEIKVLFTSGYTENAISHHGILDAGVNFIAKPYVPHALAQKIRQVLGSDRNAVSAVQAPVT